MDMLLAYYVAYAILALARDGKLDLGVICNFLFTQFMVTLVVIASTSKGSTGRDVLQLRFS